MTLHVVVEGFTDEAAAQKIAVLAGWTSSGVVVQSMRGKPHLDANLARYNDAARWTPQFVLRDLDYDKPCAGELRAILLPTSAPFMCFRLAVRSIEAWLLADPDTIAAYLHVPTVRVPLQPDLIADPKECLVNLARVSTKAAIRKDIVPGSGLSRKIGAGYPGRIHDYSAHHWRPEIARKNSPSLERAIVALARMYESWGQESGQV